MELNLPESTRADSFNAAKSTLAVILAGGRGARLQSLTRWHSKPAIPFACKFRTIDFPLSNCVNSHIRKICILTQYKSHSLNSHIQKGWNFFRPELDEFVDLIPAQQRTIDDWYRGTADAVMQNLDIIRSHKPRYILVLAGDHIYKMNYAAMIQSCVDSDADITVGCIEVPLAAAREFGVMSVDKHMRITDFAEKPAQPRPHPSKPDVALASMGIYVFKAERLYQMLHEDTALADSKHDFGADIIPGYLNRCTITAYPFRDPISGQQSYWRDVGTIDAYYQANIDLCSVTPELNLYDNSWPIWTYHEQLPPAKFVFDDDDRRGMAVDSLISAGCIISGGKVSRSLLSNNVRVNSYSEVSDSVILPNVSIGRNCRLHKVIIDRDCKIPANSVIGFDHREDAKKYYVSPGGVVLVSADMLGQEFSYVS